MSFSLGEFFAAVQHGAVSVYHHVLATGVAVIEWEAAHPALQPFVDQGVVVASGLLTRFTGLPVDRVVVSGVDIVNALKGLVVHDATVPSVPATTTTTTTATTTMGALESVAIVTAEALTAHL